MDDSVLLRQFVEDRSEAALAGLVGRYVDLVYSAARRQMKDASLTEDVTQAVFVLLAEKARTIRDGEALAGWLLVTTRFVALNTIRAEARRRKHEREAAVMRRDMQSDEQPGTAPRWESIGPMLDDAVARLKREDRDALAMRYFQGRSVAEVATSMGISHEAAQKRVSRAVEKLRRFFADRGITTSAGGLESALASNAIIAAPAMLCAKISTVAISTAAGSSLAMGKGTVTLVAAAKTKLIAASVAAAVLVGVTGTIAYQQLSGPSAKTRQVAVSATLAAQPAAPPASNVRTPMYQPATATQPAQNWMANLRDVYALKDGENLKRVPPPFLQDRLLFYKTYMDPQQSNPGGPDVILFRFDGSNFTWTNAMYSGGNGGSVAYAMEAIGGISPKDRQIPQRILAMPLSGDWVMRKGVAKHDCLGVFSGIISQVTGQSGKLVEKPIERDAIVVSGKLAVTPLPDAAARHDQTGPNPVYLFRGDLKSARVFNGMTCTVAVMLNEMGDRLNRPIVNEISGNPSDAMSPQDCLTGEDAAEIDTVLANLAKQTSLQFKQEKRVVPTWVWETTP
jgi:RNA polymerase sigma factor (sigma-70 family)